MTLVLASASTARQALLRAAAIDVEIDPARIDERAAETPLIDAGAGVADLALALAMVKATTVSRRRPGDLVIGADQTLELDGERFTKPADMDAARRQLLALSGRTHRLHTAVACARGDEVLWQTCQTADMTMRQLSPRTVGHYLAAAGETVLQSVGAYQIEGRGIRLFDRMEGDHFAILGLPMLPLLAFLRGQGVIDQ